MRRSRFDCMDYYCLLSLRRERVYEYWRFGWNTLRATTYSNVLPPEAISQKLGGRVRFEICSLPWLHYCIFVRRPSWQTSNTCSWNWRRQVQSSLHVMTSWLQDPLSQITSLVNLTPHCDQSIVDDSVWSSGDKNTAHVLTASFMHPWQARSPQRPLIQCCSNLPKSVFEYGVPPAKRVSLIRHSFCRYWG